LLIKNPLKLYKVNNLSKLENITIRYNLLSKKYFKKSKKSTLVYLRSPKHFNIGKHKVFSFKNFFALKLTLNFKIYLQILLKYPIFLIKFLPKLTEINNLRKVNSLRVKAKVNIK